jgi:hypothetical protein
MDRLMKILYVLFLVFHLLRAILCQDRNKTAYLLYLTALDLPDGLKAPEGELLERIKHRYPIY